MYQAYMGQLKKRGGKKRKQGEGERVHTSTCTGTLLSVSGMFYLEHMPDQCRYNIMRI